MKPIPVGKVKGVLLFSNERAFFRIYGSNGEFEDYDISHSDMGVIIDDEDVYVYEDKNGDKYLDHSPQPLGIKE